MAYEIDDVKLNVSFLFTIADNEVKPLSIPS